MTKKFKMSTLNTIFKIENQKIVQVSKTILQYEKSRQLQTIISLQCNYHSITGYFESTTVPFDETRDFSKNNSNKYLLK